MKRGGLLFVFGLFLIFVLVGMVSGNIAADAASCTGTVLFSISGSSNAHAAVPSDTAYTNVSCFDGETVTVNETGTEGSTFLRLSGLTNAHVGNPGTTYAINLSSPDFSCTYNASSNGCDSGTCVASVSGMSNAHVGECFGPNSYTTLLCCQLGVPSDICGDGLVTGTEICDIGIDGIPGNSDDNVGAETCVSQGYDSGNLYCSIGCGSYDTSSCIFNNPTAYWSRNGGLPQIDKANLGETIFMIFTNANGLTVGNSIGFDIYEDDPGSAGFIRTINGEVYDSGGGILQANATWAISVQDLEKAKESSLDPPLEGFYFIVNGNTSNNLEVIEDFVMPTHCSNYVDEVSCNSFNPSVATTSVHDQYGGEPHHIQCGTAGLPNGCDERTSCSCFWNSSSSECGAEFDIYETNCPSGINYPSEVGLCASYANTGDTCDEDGFLTYSWRSDWSWGIDNPSDPSMSGDPLYIRDENGEWHYDPEKRSLACVDGSNAIPCPPSVQLPFFTWINLIIAVIVFLIIYSALDSVKKTKKKK